MKRCLLCHYVDENDVDATCPRCGEATWQFAAVPEVEPDPEPEIVEEPKRRGRK